MAFYYECPFCGSSLDHGERCDCMNEQKSEEHCERVVGAQKKSGALSLN